MWLGSILLKDSQKDMQPTCRHPWGRTLGDLVSLPLFINVKKQSATQWWIFLLSNLYRSTHIFSPHLLTERGDLYWMLQHSCLDWRLQLITLFMGRREEESYHLNDFIPINEWMKYNVVPPCTWHICGKATNADKAFWHFYSLWSSYSHPIQILLFTFGLLCKITVFVTWKCLSYWLSRHRFPDSRVETLSCCCCCGCSSPHMRNQ